MSASNMANLVIGLLALVFIIFKQLRARPAEADMRLPLVLAAIGLIQLTQFLHRGDHGTDVFAALTGSLVIAAAFAVVRVATVHVWVDGGQPWRKGNWLTAVSWVVSLGVHIGYDYLVDGRGVNAGLGWASALPYFAATYSIQRLIVEVRAKSIGAAQGLDADTHITVRWP